MADDLGVWLAGDAYVPVLGQIQLYQLRAQLRIHPLLERKRKDVHLSFNLRTTEAGTIDNARVSHPLGALREAPATHPRVQQLYVISDKAPWYTTVRNDAGVTVGDVVDALNAEFRKYITEWEWTQLGAYAQERIRRLAIAMEHEEHDAFYTAGRGPPPPPPANAIIPAEGRAYRRSLWLRENCYVELITHDDKLVEHRFGFKAPDCLVMVMTA